MDSPNDDDIGLGQMLSLVEDNNSNIVSNRHLMIPHQKMHILLTKVVPNWIYIHILCVLR